MPTLDEIAALVGGRVDGPADLEVTDLQSLADAGPTDLVFVKDERHLAQLSDSGAAAVLCRASDDVGERPAIRVANPRLAAATVARFLHPEPVPPPGVHPSACVDESAVVPASCSVGAGAVVGSESRLGEHVVLGAHAVVGNHCRIGAQTRLYAHVVLYDTVRVGNRCEIHAGVVIGSPGFGVEMGEDGPVAFPQCGTVVIGDDVRIGANTTIDRATFGKTELGDGVKIDNLVQVGHNVTIGDGVIICALSGIGGGARFEDRSVLGPQGALAPDATLGAGSILGARGGLQSHGRLDDPGRVYMGTPPIPVEDWRRWVVLRRRLKRGKPLRG